jgi:hypothetical protein
MSEDDYESKDPINENVLKDPVWNEHYSRFYLSS